MCKSEVGRIEGYDREVFKFWDLEKKVTAVQGDRDWPEKIRFELR